MSDFDVNTGIYRVKLTTAVAEHPDSRFYNYTSWEMGITASVVANPTNSESYNYTADVVVDDPNLQC